MLILCFHYVSTDTIWCVKVAAIGGSPAEHKYCIGFMIIGSPTMYCLPPVTHRTHFVDCSGQQHVAYCDQIFRTHNSWCMCSIQLPRIFISRSRMDHHGPWPASFRQIFLLIVYHMDEPASSCTAPSASPSQPALRQKRGCPLKYNTPTERVKAHAATQQAYYNRYDYGCRTVIVLTSHFISQKLGHNMPTGSPAISWGSYRCPVLPQTLQAAYEAQACSPRYQRWAKHQRGMVCHITPSLTTTHSC